jgi:hypothetical protein
MYMGYLSLLSIPDGAVDTVRSVRKLHQVARQTAAMIVAGDDTDAWLKFKKSPQYYE